ncbi:MAG: hypothetical protein JW786_07755 [Desulfobacterales bacterium]|nr:hypothetical protein [Desulfobacterales bacterium]
MAKKKRKNKFPKTNSPKRIYREKSVDISEAILTITNSFIENNLHDEISNLRSLISLSVIAWNVSLYPESNQKDLHDQITKRLPDTFSADTIAGFATIIEKIMNEKKKLYPDVNRLIEKHTVSYLDDKIEIDVKSIPFKINGKKKPKKTEAKTT